MNRIALMVMRNLTFAVPAYMKLRKYAKDPDKYPLEEMWQHIQKILKRGITSGNIDLHCTGIENIPQEGGFLLYGNHQGYFDVVAVAATCDLPACAVAKKQLKDLIFVGEVLTCTYSYLLDREDARQSLRTMREVANDVQEKDRRVMIFPEGTRSKMQNQMGEFHDGSFKPALRAKCPIVPVAFVNCYTPFDNPGSDPVTVEIHYLKPIPYEEYKDMKTPQIAEMVKSRIQEKIDESLAAAE